MTDSFNVIGDIAGQYKTLMALIAKMPQGKVISVGDIIDRGPRNKQVIEYFINADKDGTAQCLMGNHEHMMIDFYRKKNHYDNDIWLWNGGEATAEEFPGGPSEEILSFLETRDSELKLDLDGKTFYISHAFRRKPGDHSFDYTEDDPEIVKKVWNRGQPIFDKNSPDIQICGHNSQFGLRHWNGPNGKKAICIDSSRSRVLTGIHLPTLTIYQQPYIDD